MLFTKKIIFFLISTLLFGVVLWQNIHRHPKYEIVRFSYEKHPKYRQEIAEIINLEFDNPSVKVASSDIGLVPCDLNDDGVNEWLVLVNARGFIAKGGIYTVIYTQKNGKFHPIWDHCSTFGELVILDHKTNGYRDILSFVVGQTLNKQDDSKHTLVWVKDKRYDYTKTESVSDFERELLKNEEL